MRVILRQRVDNLGDKDEVREVSAGYARNYLIARGLAELATPADIIHAKLRQKNEVVEKNKKAASLNELSAQLAKAEITVSAKANPAGRLFGSVDEKAVRQLLEKKYGLKIPTEARLDGSPIKQVGTSRMQWRLPGGRVVGATIKVTSKSDG